MNKLITELRNMGLMIDSPILDGTIQRTYTETTKKSGKKNGWYIGWTKYLGNKDIICCSMGDWAKGGGSLATYKSWKDDHTFTQSDLTTIKALQLEQQRKVEAAKIKQHKEAAKKATEQWLNLSETGNSRYLESKGIKGYGLRYGTDSKEGDYIAIPIRNYEGDLKGLQLIYDTPLSYDPTRSKTFTSGVEKKSNFHTIGSVNPSIPLCFVEGYATGASVHEATDYPVIVCFDAGNIKPVVEAWRKQNPTQHLIICADNDQWKESNTGIDKAKEAAKNYGCCLAIPDFTDLDISDKPTDFNDLHTLAGSDKVKAIITSNEKADNLSDGYPTVQHGITQPVEKEYRQQTSGQPIEPYHHHPSFDNYEGQIDYLEQTPLTYDFPTFDNAHYYGIAGDLSALAIQNSEADRMAVYMSFLCATAALFDRKKYLSIGETKHHARLFATLVGASSRARNGTSLQPVKRIINEAEAILNPDSKDRLKFAEGGLSSAEGLIYQVRDESEETKNKQPIWSGVDDKRLFVIEEEFGNALKQGQREGNTLSPTLRRAWDGGTLAPMTKNNKLTATGAHINILGHITHCELKILMSESDIYNGLANRFLWCCVRRTQKIAIPLPMDDSKTQALAVRLADAMRFNMTESEVTLSSQAVAYWTVKYHEISRDETGIVNTVTARAETYVLRVALLFALLDCKNVIDKHHIIAACHLVEFCRVSVAYIFSVPSLETGTDADRLLNALNGKDMSQSDISKLYNGHKSREDLITLLNELQTMNKIKQTKQTGSKKIIWSLIK